jgi:hypothetical protein
LRQLEKLLMIAYGIWTIWTKEYLPQNLWPVQLVDAAENWTIRSDIQTLPLALTFYQPWYSGISFPLYEPHEHIESII